MSGWTIETGAGEQTSVRRVLTIAGSDSGGGAGIQADLKTFQELETFGMSVITAVTAQNSLGVHGIYPMQSEAVAAQLDAVLDDIGADVVKTGMLGSAEIIQVVADKLAVSGGLPLVVDPVMISKHGSRLLREDALEVLRSRLLPLATVITPNIPEACVLLGLEEGAIGSIADMESAARGLLQFGSHYVFLKGGHLDGVNTASDLLLVAANPSEPVWLSAPKLPTPHTHGTGCTIASALTSLLAKGLSMEEAARGAKEFTLAAIAWGGPLGEGTGSLWHAAWRRDGLECFVHPTLDCSFQ